MLEFLLYVSVILGPLVFAYYLGLFSGALYIPTDVGTVDAMLDAAELKEGDRLVDIGSGDGRLIIAAAQRGIRADGYEINPLLVWLSNRKIRRENLEHHAHAYWKNFWRVDLSAYSVITVFGIKHIMMRLGGKLRVELSPQSRVVSNLFPLPNWEGRVEEGVYVYTA